MKNSQMYFGSINAPFGRLPKKNVYGLQVANHQFMQALLRYGSFAEYHFFVSNNRIAEFSKFLKSSYGKEENFNKIKIISFNKIKDCFQKYKYLVFHNGDPLVSNYYFVRQEVGIQNFPISCFVHTVSGYDIPSRLMQNILANTKN